MTNKSILDNCEQLVQDYLHETFGDDDDFAFTMTDLQDHLEEFAKFIIKNQK